MSRVELWPAPPNYNDVVQLSILVPSIPTRVDYYPLRKELRAQIEKVRMAHPTLGQVEVVVDRSKKFTDGGLSIGKKREGLVMRAKGKYLCFLDDDEMISPNYVEALLRLCYLEKDVCTFRNISKLDNYWCIIEMGLGYEQEQATPVKIVRRPPWHVCPVKSEFAKQFQFPDSNYGEDWTWFKNVLALCKTEAKSNEVLHEYRHSDKKSEANKAHRYV